MSKKQHYDYIVVGTGPGGATVANELADGKKNILIVEYGPRLDKTGFIKIAKKAFLDKSKKPLRSDGDIWFGRARILGGSSFVAMGNAATPPQKIWDEWGFDLYEELEWARSALRVTPMPEEFMGEATKRMRESATNLGWVTKPTPKCVDFSKCKKCSLCMFGCPTGAKWNSVEFIDSAVSKGAELMLETEVTRILTTNGKVSGISAIRNGQDIQIEAENVILSAGGIGTPIILQNTGIDAGKGLAGDIFQIIYGHHPEVGMKGEIILGIYLESAYTERELFPAPYMYIPVLIQRDIDGGLPEKISNTSQAIMMLKSKKIDAMHLIGMMTKIRDERTGEVHKDGTISKQLTAHDKSKLEEAYKIEKEIMIGAGAEPDSIFTGLYESGHPCCTAAIGEVINTNQETEIFNLFVSDASAFPTPLGMPPILTIVALSKRLANYLASR